MLPRQCGAPYYTLNHLSSHALRSIASHAVSRSVGDLCRGSLTASVATRLRATNPLSWDVHDGKVRLAAGDSLSCVPCITCADVNASKRLCKGQPSTVWSQGTFPQRMFAHSFSYLDELYVFGGLPTSVFLEESMLDHRSEEEPFMLKLDQNTHLWESVSLKGAPKASWTIEHCTSNGVKQISTQQLCCIARM